MEFGAFEKNAAQLADFYQSVQSHSFETLKMSKKKGGGCIWNNEFSKLFPGMTVAKSGKRDHCHCGPCAKDLSFYHKGKKDIEKHLSTKEHKGNCAKLVATKSLPNIFAGKFIQIFLPGIPASQINL